MNERPPLDQLVTDWLRSDAPAGAPRHVLDGALERASGLGQERYLTQRLLGDSVGRSPRIRWALALGLLALAILGAAAVAGAVLHRDPPVDGRSPANGWIAFAANGRAGSALESAIVEPRAGDKDIYIVGGDGSPRRVVGTEDDGIAQTCPMFSPDGSRLVYRELDLAMVTPTPPPVPLGASSTPLPEATRSPRPRAPGSSPWTFVVASIGADGSPAGVPIRITPRADQDENVSCPIWSPDGGRLAYTTDPRKDLWIVTLDRQFTHIPPPLASFNADPHISWSPDGRTIAFAYVDRVWLFRVDGGAAETIATGEVESVSWSPDGRQLIVFRDSALHVFARSGTELFAIPAPDPRQAAGFWSPDGRWIACVANGRLELVSGDGSTSREVAVDAPALAGRPLEGLGFSIVSWSPDGKRLLVSVGQPLGATALASVPLNDEEPTVLLVPLTLALGGGVTWQAIYP